MKLNIRELKARAAALTAEHRSAARLLVLWYCGVTAVLTLGSNGLNLYLDSQIVSTGGLSGIGLRSILQTIQEILTLVNQFFGPFWSAGFLLAMMGMVRGYAPHPRTLVEGFRRFFTVLGHMAFRFLLMVVTAITAVNLSAALFSLTPLGQRFSQEMTQVMSDPNFILPSGAVNMELIPQELMLEAGLPLTGLVMALFGLLYLYICYPFRLSMYLMLRQPMGAIRAHFESLRLMRGHKWSMLKLDLSWWYYYLLTVLIGVVGYLDLIMGLLGLPLPMDETVMFFATMAAYCVLITALCLWKKCQMDASYVMAFEAIANPETEEAAPEIA